MTSGVTSRIVRFRTSRFYAALVRAGDEYLQRGAPAWYREILGRVRGREEAFLLEEVLPRIEPRLAQALEAELAAGGEHATALLVAAMHAMPAHRPRFIAQEVVKAEALVERRVLEDALAGLSPSSWFTAHLGAGAQRLREAAPEAFASDVTGCDDLRQRAQRLESAAVAAGERARAAWTAYAELARHCDAFDYGCGGGALMKTFAAEFRVDGGDLFQGVPHDVMHRPLAVLRTVDHPDDAVSPDGRIAAGRVVTLDPVPGQGSPPAGRTYAVVTSIGVMEHVLDRGAFGAVLARMISLVRPGGLLLLNANPTMVGHDVHHALSPWLGTILHRVPSLTRIPGIRGRWRKDFCLRVPLASLLDPLRREAAAVAYLWPRPASVRQRLGPASIVALPLLQACARRGISLVHHLGITRRIDA